MTAQQTRASIRLGGVGLAGKDRARVIAVGELTGWEQERLYPLASEGIRLTSIEGLSESLLSAVNPGLVLSPVVAKDFDCMDIAAILDKSRFLGMYRAVTQRAVHPQLVTSEVRALYPDLDFDIMLVGTNRFFFA